MLSSISSHIYFLQRRTLMIKFHEPSLKLIQETGILCQVLCKHFQFSLVSTLKLLEDGEWLQSLRCLLFLGLTFFFGNDGILICSPILKLKASNTFTIIGFNAEATIKLIRGRCKLGMQSLKRKVFNSLFFLKSSFNVTNTKWNWVQSEQNHYFHYLFQSRKSYDENLYLPLSKQKHHAI